MKIFGYLGLLTLHSLVSGQEKLIVREDIIYTVASFDIVDYFSSVDREGKFLWEIPFSSKIQSFEEAGQELLVLSQKRNGSAYFLSCIEKGTGKVLWEKGIYAPQQNDSAAAELVSE